MPVFKRGRAAYAPGARRAPVSTRRAGRWLRRVNVPMLSSALSRTHTFKRVGEPLYIMNNSASGFTLNGNVDIVNAGSQLSFSNGPLTNSRQLLGALRFCLAQAANITDVTNLFDNYRLRKVKLMIAFTATGAPGDAVTGVGGGALSSATGVSTMPIMHHCYDPDDSVVPPSRTSVLENGYCKSTRMDRVVYVTITPRAQSVITGGGAAGGGLMPLGQWLDSSSPNVYHYGLKFAIDGFPWTQVDSSLAVVITPTYYIEGRNVV